MLKTTLSPWTGFAGPCGHPASPPVLRSSPTRSDDR